MGIALPAGLTMTRQSLASSATANTATTGTQVAAPGAGFRIRLWACLCVPGLTSQAVVNWKAMVTSNVGGAPIAGATGANFLGSGPVVIPGGWPLANNLPLGWLLQAALASMTIEVITWHTVEQN